MDMAGLTDRDVRERVRREAMYLSDEEARWMLMIRQANLELKVDGIAQGLKEVRGTRSMLTAVLHGANVLYATTLFFLFGQHR